jgi:predicted metal-dependent peptidase
MTPAIQRLMAARTALVLQEPFFGTLALHLQIREGGAKTASVDGETLAVNPEWVAALSHEQATSLIAQAVMHCAMGHPWRRDGREPKRWNQACHLAIADVLSEAGFALPPDAPVPTADQHGKSAEWIYDRLPEPDPDPDEGDGAGSGSGSGGCGSSDQSGDGDGQDQGQDQGGEAGAGDHAPGSACGVDDADAAAGAGDGDGDDAAPVTEADWQQAVRQAVVAAKNRGSLPACIERFAGQAVEPRVDWRSVLRRFAQTAAKNDYSWRRPSTRYLAASLYLPSLHNEEAGPIAVCIDTSGSIDEVMLDQFRSEVQVILEDIRPAALAVIYCDAEVGRIDVFRPGDTIEFRPVGGGGTAFGPALRAAEQLDEPPVCIVYLTDLDGSCHHRPEIPVLWVSTTERQGPFGETVRVS